MTPSTADHAQMSVEEFEQLARTAPETVTLEFINGRLEVKPAPDGDHDEIIMWVAVQCVHHRPDLRLYRERGLRVEEYRNGRARPDGTLARARRFAGDGEWSSSDGVLMTVEVTSYGYDTDRRDRTEKRDTYAAADIPVHLLIDRDNDTLVVHSEPEKGRYRQQTTYGYGDTVTLPAPVDVTLDTEELKDYAR
ncbi:Uma2 family endonuclease [Streptomyces sp. NBC_01237]|uniref:Uma2 family endonuclease n=1 Tax=Streptomyces sp. NBC_01237 TaxID=2903790 RepID=UPI002DDBB78D|nr:Uma2 family endonuclease [Streptomyces sp. NBC_01237]WRZ74152.1 Uma2 family endonuclease [Streptomyces sp. NBC_01237]